MSRDFTWIRDDAALADAVERIGGGPLAFDLEADSFHHYRESVQFDPNPQVRDVWLQLDKVCDPELDEPITDMGFVEDLDIDETGRVSVSFRLPTYWCSANFAYLMASDIRVEVEKLVWVSCVRVRLQDHMFEDQVNTVLANLRIASHADVHKLERKVAQLNKKVRELEKLNKQEAA